MKLPEIHIHIHVHEETKNDCVIERLREVTVLLSHSRSKLQTALGLTQAEAQHRSEVLVMTVEEALAALTAEVAAVETVEGSAVAFINSVPGLIQAAVDAAVAAGGSLNDAQAASFQASLDSLTAKTAEVTAALTANTPNPNP